MSTDTVIVRVGDHTANREQMRRVMSRDRRAGPTVQHSSPSPALANQTEGDAERQLLQVLRELQRHPLPNLTPLLPFMFRLKGSPYSLEDHFPFEAAFDTAMPSQMVYKTGRQVAKSTSMAAKMIATATTIPYFNSLYITPLFETTRRFSGSYVAPFIDTSPLRREFIDARCNRSVLQRTFKNGSMMFFSFAFLDALRTRGINSDGCWFDEIQDMDPEHIPIIKETLSGSKWSVSGYTGTAKTYDGILEDLWQHSSQAEWHIWCKACKHENIPSKEYDLDRMTGPSFVRREISEAQPGVVCAKCQKPILPRTGRWVHHKPERRQAFPGRHVPQAILPLHYADPLKWRNLLGKREIAPHLYYNEVCGESYDIGAKLITETELREACNPERPNSLDHLEKVREDYIERVVSVDWGGGGETEISRTVITAMGMRPDMSIDVLFAHRFRAANDYRGEVAGIFDVWRRFQATHMVHDMGGQGATREHIMVNAGMPMEQIIPVLYVRAGAGSLMKYVHENVRTQQRGYYQLDKARSLLQTCELIRYKQLRFFKYDYVDRDRPGLIREFLALVEDVVQRRMTGQDVYTIIRSATGGPDDFAQAVNIGACGLFQLRGEWPNLARVTDIEVDPELMSAFSPEDPDWGYY